MHPLLKRLSPDLAGWTGERNGAMVAGEVREMKSAALPDGAAAGDPIR
jgi:hypothetical protein